MLRARPPSLSPISGVKRTWDFRGLLGFHLGVHKKQILKKLAFYKLFQLDTIFGPSFTGLVTEVIKIISKCDCHNRIISRFRGLFRTERIDYQCWSFVHYYTSNSIEGIQNIKADMWFLIFLMNILKSKNSYFMRIGGPISMVGQNIEIYLFTCTVIWIKRTDSRIVNFEFERIIHL